MRPWTQKSALTQPKTSFGKGLKNVYSKGPRWLYILGGPSARFRAPAAELAPGRSLRRYQRNDLEYTFFQTYFQNFGNKMFNNFCNFSQIPMKYHHFDITPIKITEIL